MKISAISILIIILFYSCRLPSKKRMSKKDVIQESKLKIDVNLPIKRIERKVKFNKQKIVLNTKKSSITQDRFIIDNMPGITSDGKFAVILSSQYSCCVGEGLFFNFYDMDNNKKIKSIQISPSELEIEEGKWINANYDSIRTIVNDIIKAKEYLTCNLINIPDWRSKQNDNKHFFISLTYKNIKYKSKPILLDDVKYDNSWCCLGEIKEGFNCQISPKVMQVWKAQNSNYFLIEYGVVSSINGCDQGPFYKIINLKNSISHKN